MKIHTRPFQHVEGLAYKFSVESDQKNGNAKCFKK